MDIGLVSLSLVRISLCNPWRLNENMITKCNAPFCIVYTRSSATLQTMTKRLLNKRIFRPTVIWDFLIFKQTHTKLWLTKNGEKIPENNVITVSFVNLWYRIRNTPPPPPISTPAFRGLCLLTPITKKQTCFSILAQYVHDMRVSLL